jgi:hypothetical protein
VKDEPSETPVDGSFVFSDADLSTLDGVRGTLSATGAYTGRITAIDVHGTTSTPDFNLAMGGKGLPLHTTFAATVDGTNGTTVLHKVDATLRRSSIVATGAIVNLPGDGRHSIDLDVTVPKGRIEDLLSLVTSAEPPAAGDVTLHTTVHLPPGRSATLTRLALAGRFGMRGARFSPNVQARVQELSRRTQGRSDDNVEGPVKSDVGGTFNLTDGVLRLEGVSFTVPGSTIALDGSCNLRTRALDLAGTLTMRASVSQAVGGFKSVFLKLVDPFFRKHGAGTVLPIRLGGTIEEPRAALNFRRKPR